MKAYYYINDKKYWFYRDKLPSTITIFRPTIEKLRSYIFPTELINSINSVDTFTYHLVVDKLSIFNIDHYDNFEVNHRYLRYPEKQKILKSSLHKVQIQINKNQESYYVNDQYDNKI